MARNTENVRNQLATRGRNAPAQKKTEFGLLSDFLDQLKPQMALALPKHLNPDRLARLALNEVRRQPRLAQCTQESFAGAIMTCCQLGLEPGGPLGEAWPIAFKNNKTRQYEVNLIIGYQGMLKLFWQSPIARHIDAQAVYENDYFDYAYGLEQRLEHRPTLKDRGQPIAYYAVMSTTNGGSGFVVLSPEDIEKIRERSRAKDDGPWKTDYDAMAKKTCIRQLFKLMPKSTALANALAVDETVRNYDTSSNADLGDIIDVPAAVEAEPRNDDIPPSPDEAPATPPADETPSPETAVTKDQLAKIQQGFTACGWSDPADQLRAVVAISGRDVSPSHDPLSNDEAQRLLGVLADCGQSDDPQSALTDRLESMKDADDAVQPELGES